MGGKRWGAVRGGKPSQHALQWPQRRFKKSSKTGAYLAGGNGEGSSPALNMAQDNAPLVVLGQAQGGNVVGFAGNALQFLVQPIHYHLGKLQGLVATVHHRFDFIPRGGKGPLGKRQ